MLAILQSLVLSQAGVEFRLQKGEEEIKEVDSETVSDNVPALSKDYTEEE